jgi:hypothetical protein
MHERQFFDRPSTANQTGRPDVIPERGRGVFSRPVKEVDVLERIPAILSAVCLATSVGSSPKSPFVGEWKLAPSRSRMPDDMKVLSKDGNTYLFDFGAGAVETIDVDGSDQPGVGATTLSVKPEAADTWIVTRKNGSRLLIKATWKLSGDGASLTDYFREFESDGSTFSVDYIYRRTGRGSGFAGDWRSVKETINSPFLLEVKDFQRDGLSFVDPLAGKTRNLMFDTAGASAGKVSTAGSGASSTLRRVDECTLVITNKYDGKLSNTEEFALSSDLRTLTMTVHIVGRDIPYVLTFQRT